MSRNRQDKPLRRSMGLGVATMVALATGIATFAVASPAGAIPVVATCNKVSGDVSTMVLLGRCTPQPGGHASLSIPANVLTMTGSAVVTWAFESHHVQQAKRVRIKASGPYEPTVNQTGCWRGHISEEFDFAVVRDPTQTLSSGSAGFVDFCLDPSTGGVHISRFGVNFVFIGP